MEPPKKKFKKKMAISMTVEIDILGNKNSFGPPFGETFFESVKWVPYFAPTPRDPRVLIDRGPRIESFNMLNRSSLPILA